MKCLSTTARCVWPLVTVTATGKGRNPLLPKLQTKIAAAYQPNLVELGLSEIMLDGLWFLVLSLQELTKKDLMGLAKFQ